MNLSANKPRCRPFERNTWDSSSFPSHSDIISIGFRRPEVVETSLPGIGILAGEPDVGLAPTLVIISNRTINWQEMCVGLRLGFKLLSCQAGGLTIRSCLLLVLLAHRSQIHGRISEKCRFLQSLCQKISSLFCKLEEHWLSGYCLFLSSVISLSSFLIFWGKSGSCLSLYSFSCAVYALLSMEPGFP